MGHITKDSKELFHEYLELLTRDGWFKDTLIALDHQKALELLIEEVWSHDEDAIVMSGLTIMDALNLVACVHNKRSLEKLKKQLVELENQYLTDDERTTLTQRRQRKKT